MSHLVEMETFLKVAARASFSAAARELGLSPASVSRRILTLEQDLGLKLINRSTRSLSLTEGGQKYLNFAERIISQIQREEAELGRAKSEPAGLLKVLVSKSFGSLHMGQAAAEFMTDYPQVKISIVVSDVSLSSLDPIASGFDMAIRLGEPSSSRLVASRIGAARWFACASPAYLTQQGEPRAPSDLRNHQCILNRMYFSNGRWAFETKASKPESVTVNGAAMTNSVIVARQLALSGMGIALLPDYCAGSDLKSGALKRILANYSLPSQVIRAIYARDMFQPKHLKLFVGFLRARFAKPEWSV